MSVGKKKRLYFYYNDDEEINIFISKDFEYKKFDETIQECVWRLRRELLSKQKEIKYPVIVKIEDEKKQIVFEASYKYHEIMNDKYKYPKKIDE